jgi:polyferredoxin
MRTIRRISQLSCLVLFVFLLTRASYPLNESLPIDLFPRLSPLLGIVASVASRALVTAFWPALVVVMATMVFGRAFCGWVCPMGTTLDITDKIFKRKGNPVADRKPAHRNWKFGLLVCLIIASVFGVQLAGWFDPLSLATRTYGMVVIPYVNYLSERALDLLFLIPGLAPVLYPVEDSLREHVFSFQQLVFSSHALFALIFVGIVALGSLHRRFWCRSLCPLGATLALIGRYPLLKRKVNEKCINCLKCQRSCMTDAIVQEGAKTLKGECVYCFTCQDVCPEDAVSFSFRKSNTTAVEGGVLGRRAFLTTSLAGVSILPLVKLNYQKKSLYPWIIRPPGVDDEVKFLAECVRCGECMKVCLKNALQPTLLDAGTEGLWTPKLVPRVGYCEYNCTLCGQVCPSGAIPELTREEKHKVRMGKAFFDKDRCIPWVAYDRWNENTEWSERYNCAVCEEHCPTAKKAIRFSDVVVRIPGGLETIRRPMVIEEECIGCGICEYVCPLDGPAAVRVISVKAARNLEGEIGNTIEMAW